MINYLSFLCHSNDDFIFNSIQKESVYCIKLPFTYLSWLIVEFCCDRLLPINLKHQADILSIYKLMVFIFFEYLSLCILNNDYDIRFVIIG